ESKRLVATPCASLAPFLGNEPGQNEGAHDPTSGSISTSTSGRAHSPYSLRRCGELQQRRVITWLCSVPETRFRIIPTEMTTLNSLQQFAGCGGRDASGRRRSLQPRRMSHWTKTKAMQSEIVVGISRLHFKTICSRGERQ